jgi:hypothetical protein
MGTNYYRIPTEQEMEERQARLAKRIQELEMTPSNIERRFSTIPTHDSDYVWEHESPWDEFTNGTSIHLGKRSSGWKFCWNFHTNKYYSTKAELLAFIEAGRVVDEYGTEWTADEFIQMAMEWGQPDGLVGNAEYFEKYERNLGASWKSYVDLEIDGLRVSSSTEFC